MSFRLEYVASEPDSHAEAGQVLHKSARSRHRRQHVTENVALHAPFW